MSTLLRSSPGAYMGQLQVSEQRRMPVDDGTTSNVQSVTGETVQFFYYNASTGVLTQDAGQAAGTVVVANLTNKNILNALGDVIGNYGDTSFAFTTGTILTTLKPFRGLLAEQAEQNGLSQTKAGQARAIAVTEGFGRGDYCIDYERGVIYGVKATNGTSDTGAYKVLAPGGGASVPENVNIAKVGGAAQDAAAAVGDASASPTAVGSFGAYTRLYNGTTWDRARSGQTSNSATVTGFLNDLPMARYDAAPTARTTGQFGNLQADANGNLNTNEGTLGAGEDLSANNVQAVVEKPLAVSTYALSWDDSAALEASSVVKASAGNAFVAFGWNNNGATRYFQVFNSTTVPADTAVPIISFPVGAGQVFSVDFSRFAKNFGTGIAWANSTTAATKTVGGADFWVNFGYL